MPASRKGRFGALFCSLLSAVVLGATPAAQAQKQPKIGVTLAGSPPDRFAEAFRLGLAERGWVAGRNITIEYRYAAGKVERFPGFIDEFVKANVDVIVAGGGVQAQQSAKQATRTIPIVFPVAGDPVRSGLVKSLARPGGNLTGISLMTAEFSAKRVELLKEAFPKIGRVAVLMDPEFDLGQRKATEAAAKSLGIRLLIVSASRPEELEPAFQEFAKARTEAILILSSGFLNANRKRLIALVERNRLVAVYDNREYAEAGGLMTYGPDVAELYRTAAKYVDRILKGAKPGDLPIEQPTKFELLVNLRAAKALGIDLPRAILLRADHVLN